MKFSILFFSLLYFFSFNSLFAQDLLKQDSFHIDQGIPQTQEFLPYTRNVVEEHDTDGRPIIIVKLQKNAEGEWTPVRRRQIDYDGNKLAGLTIQAWNDNSQMWIDFRQRDFEYQPNGQLESRTFQKYVSSEGGLQNNRRWSYSYDDEQRLENVLFQRWQDGQWENAGRQNFNYEQGQLMEQLYQRWEMGGWVNSRRQVFTYDPDHGGLMSTTGQQWSEEEEVWINNRRKSTSYQNGGLWSTFSEQLWDADAESWRDTIRQHLLSGGPQNQFEGRMRQVYEDGEWKNQFRGAYSFDGTVMNAQFENWQSDLEEWSKDSRYRMDFDPEGRLLMSRGWQRWNAQMSDWENDTTTLRYTYFWSALMTATSEPEQEYSCRIPNPYSVGTPFSCDLPLNNQPYTLELFDLLGRRVWEARFSAGEQLTIDRQLAGGTYVLRIRQDNRVFHLQQLISL